MTVTSLILWDSSSGLRSGPQHLRQGVAIRHRMPIKKYDPSDSRAGKTDNNVCSGGQLGSCNLNVTSRPMASGRS